MDIKKPSIKGGSNYGYLGHFSQDKFIQQGHNESGDMPISKRPTMDSIKKRSKEIDIENDSLMNDPKVQNREDERLLEKIRLNKGL